MKTHYAIMHREGEYFPTRMKILSSEEIGYCRLHKIHTHEVRVQFGNVVLKTIVEDNGRQDAGCLVAYSN